MEQYIIQPGTPRDRASIPLATKEGTYIPNERRRERPPDSLRAVVDLWVRERPRAQLRSITATYNCVGLVFASRRTWVDTDHVPMILEEDGYYKVPALDQLKAGDVVIYRDENGTITHIGSVLSIEPVVSNATWKITVLSQWGADGEYVHPPEYVPRHLGRPTEYWTERKEVP
jgi:hypothetical protein